MFVTETVKQPTKAMAWGMMDFHGLSDLRIVPLGRTVTSDLYVEEVLKWTAASAMGRRTENGPPSAVTLAMCGNGRYEVRNMHMLSLPSGPACRGIFPKHAKCFGRILELTI